LRLHNKCTLADGQMCPWLGTAALIECEFRISGHAQKSEDFETVHGRRKNFFQGVKSDEICFFPLEIKKTKSEHTETK